MRGGLRDPPALSPLALHLNKLRLWPQMWQGQATCNLQLAAAANALIIFIRDSFVARTQRTLDMDVAEEGEEGEGVGCVLWEVQATSLDKKKTSRKTQIKLLRRG